MHINNNNNNNNNNNINNNNNNNINNNNNNINNNNNNINNNNNNNNTALHHLHRTMGAWGEGANCQGYYQKDWTKGAGGYWGVSIDSVPHPTFGHRCAEGKRSSHHGNNPIQPRLGRDLQPASHLSDYNYSTLSFVS